MSTGTIGDPLQVVVDDVEMEVTFLLYPPGIRIKRPIPPDPASVPGWNQDPTLEPGFEGLVEGALIPPVQVRDLLRPDGARVAQFVTAVEIDLMNEEISSNVHTGPLPLRSAGTGAVGGVPRKGG